MINIKQGQLSKNIGKKKYNTEQRKKGTKPPLFKNNPQGHPTFREPRIVEIGGKGKGIHLFNVGVLKEIICIGIFPTEEKK
jgi:hypothetical protein